MWFDNMILTAANALMLDIPRSVSLLAEENLISVPAKYSLDSKLFTSFFYECIAYLSERREKFLRSQTK